MAAVKPPLPRHPARRPLHTPFFTTPPSRRRHQAPADRVRRRRPGLARRRCAADQQRQTADKPSDRIARRQEHTAVPDAAHHRWRPRSRRAAQRRQHDHDASACAGGGPQACNFARSWSPVCQRRTGVVRRLLGAVAVLLPPFVLGLSVSFTRGSSHAHATRNMTPISSHAPNKNLFVGITCVGVLGRCSATLRHDNRTTPFFLI